MSVLPPPPIPKDDSAAARQEHQRRVRRILEGTHLADVEAKLSKQIANVRKEQWGEPDLVGPLIVTVYDALARAYDTAPSVSHPDAGAEVLLDPAEGQVAKAGLWPLMIHFSRDLLAMRENILRVDVEGAGANARLSYRVVPPDLVEDEARPGRPDEPVYMREARLRRHPESKRLLWAYDVLDIRDPESPSYRVINASADRAGEDLSGVFLKKEGGFVGEEYPYRKTDGTPILPYSLYHASKTGRMWDAYSNRSLVEATLNVHVMHTYLGHIMRGSAWAQRYMVDMEPVGVAHADPDGDGRGVQGVLTDPGMVLVLRTRPDASNPQVGQWNTTVVLTDVIEVITTYKRMAISDAGLDAADMIRVGGDPRSGLAVVASREGIREKQRIYEPQYRAGDERTLAISAALYNRAAGTSLPEDGYQVTHHGIPLSSAEQRELREHLVALIEAGLMDRVSAYRMLNPGTSVEAARRALGDIAAINAQFRGAA